VKPAGFLHAPSDRCHLVFDDQGQLRGVVNRVSLRFGMCGLVGISCRVVILNPIARHLCQFVDSKHERLRDAIKYLGKAIPKAEHDRAAIVTAATIIAQAAEGQEQCTPISRRYRPSIGARSGCSLIAKTVIGASGN
jgi:hypothetical protein